MVIELKTKTEESGYILGVANGNEIWKKAFGLEGFDSVNSVVQTPDGGYVLAGVIDTEKILITKSIGNLRQDTLWEV